MFQAGETHTLEVHGLLAPSVFEPFASVTIMGANLNRLDHVQVLSPRKDAPSPITP